MLADNHGNVIHLGERECSLQRRHQKVIEEAPSPLLESLPEARQSGPVSARPPATPPAASTTSGAGTVEFLVSDNAPDEFFFMEMNTRLQVEHPVTEMVTGVDLVEWQLRIAAGEELPSGRTTSCSPDTRWRRASTPRSRREFLPSGGRVLLLDETAATTRTASVRGRLRLAAGGPGNLSSYDPMIAKVIAWGEDRDGGPGHARQGARRVHARWASTPTSNTCAC